jgi:hypothetical protein
MHDFGKALGHWLCTEGFFYTKFYHLSNQFNRQWFIEWELHGTFTSLIFQSYELVIMQRKELQVDRKST